jgi:hypothetical protein
MSKGSPKRARDTDPSFLEFLPDVVLRGSSFDAIGRRESDVFFTEADKRFLLVLRLAELVVFEEQRVVLLLHDDADDLLRLQVFQAVVEVTEEEEVVELVGDVKERLWAFGLQVQTFDDVAEIGVTSEKERYYYMFLQNSELLVTMLFAFSFDKVPR